MNCARIYNTSLSLRYPHITGSMPALSFLTAPPPNPHLLNWQTTLLMRSEDVSNGFFLYSLLLDKAECGSVLILPHDAVMQKSRIEPALAARNSAMEGVGQEFYLHACDLCFVVFDHDGIRCKSESTLL